MILSAWILDLPPAVAIACLVPSILLPFCALAFLRASREQCEFSWICYLSLLAAGIWVAIATLYASEAFKAAQEGMPQQLDANLLTHPFSSWALFCAPAYPVFMTILIITLTRRDWDSFG